VSKLLKWQENYTFSLRRMSIYQLLDEVEAQAIICAEHPDWKRTQWRYDVSHHCLVTKLTGIEEAFKWIATLLPPTRKGFFEVSVMDVESYVGSIKSMCETALQAIAKDGGEK